MPGSWPEICGTNGRANGRLSVYEIWLRVCSTTLRWLLLGRLRGNRVILGSLIIVAICTRLLAVQTLDSMGNYMSTGIGLLGTEFEMSDLGSTALRFDVLRGLRLRTAGYLRARRRSRYRFSASPISSATRVRGRHPMDFATTDRARSMAEGGVEFQVSHGPIGSKPIIDGLGCPATQRGRAAICRLRLFIGKITQKGFK